MADNFGIMIVSDDAQRLWSALSVAAAYAALGKNVSVFLSGSAAACAAHDYQAACDTTHAAKGIATLAELFTSCAELGVAVSVCQTGMALCDLTAGDLKATCAATGLLYWLAGNASSVKLIF
jgi:peroxiredoxin family protein